MPGSDDEERADGIDAQPDASVGGPAGARDSDQLEDAPDRADEPTCPSCGTTDCEPAPTEAEDYRCLDCGALFDANPSPREPFDSEPERG